MIDGITGDTGLAGDFLTADDTLSIAGMFVEAEAASALRSLRLRTCWVLIPELTSDGFGSWTLDATAVSLAEGTYDVVAEVTDLAGNASTVTQTIELDLTPPAAPTIDGITDDTGLAGDFLTADDTLSIAGMFVEGEGSLGVTLAGVTYVLGVDPELTSDGFGAWTLDATAVSLADGTYDVVAAVTDLAGNASAVTQTIEVDLTPPTSTIDGITDDTGLAGDFVTSDETLSITGTFVEGEGRLAVTLDVVTYVLGVDPELTSDGFGAWTLDATAVSLAEGTYDVVAEVADLVGNASAVRQTIELDLTPPAAPTIDGITDDTGLAGDFLTADDTLSIAGMFVEGEGSLGVTLAGVTYVLGVDPELTSDGLGNWTLDATAVSLAEGTYDVFAAVTDLAGNASAVTQTIGLDWTPPTSTIDEITDDTGLAGDFLTSDDTLSVSGTFVEGEGSLAVTLAAVTYVLGVAPELTSDGLGSWTLDATAVLLAEGSYDVVAEVADLAGNASAVTQTIELDLTTPAAPTIDGITDDTGLGGDFLTSDDTLSIAGMFVEGEGSLGVTLAGVTYVLGVDPELTSDGLGSWTLDATAVLLAEGTYDVVAEVTDLAGNTSVVTQTVEVDLTPPAAPTIDGITDDTGLAGDFVTSDETLSITGTFVEGEGSLAVTLAAVTYVLGVDPELTSDGLGNWTLDATAVSFAEGTYDVVAEVTDLAGNASTVTQTVELDLTAPVFPTINTIDEDTGLPGDLVTSDDSLSFAGTWTEGDGTLRLNVDAVDYVLGAAPELTSDGNGSWTLDLTALALPEGSHTVIAVVEDVAGNVSSVTETVSIDTTAPLAPTVDNVTEDTETPGDFITTDQTVLLSGSWPEGDGTLSVAVNSSMTSLSFIQGVDAELTSDGSSTWTLDLTATTLSAGLYSTTVAVEDLAGNTASVVQPLTIDVETTVAIGFVDRGIAVDDLATGTGYILHSAESLFTRFATNPPLNRNSEQLIAVRFNGSNWQYNNNAAWFDFLIRADDRLIATVDFTNDTIASLEGASGQVEGVEQGFDSSDLVFQADAWNGSFNNGEFLITGTSFTYAPSTDETFSVVPINRGVAVQDDAVGTGYLMYSVESVFTRFPVNTPLTNNADHLIAVRYVGSQWQYNNNSGWFSFTRETDDRLLASLDFQADTVASLQGQTATLHGVMLGFDGGDLAFQADVWQGVSNNGEFFATGSFFTVANSGNSQTVSIGPVNRGVAVDDLATGIGYLMFSSQSLPVRFATNPPLANTAEHIIAVRFDNGQWQYNDNFSWIEFTPAAGDRLLAVLDFSNNTATSLEGSSGTVSGIERGYLSGDLSFEADTWAGNFNAGEFDITGTFFTF